jgi:DNA-binding NarL/FixJ family response regulator
MAATEPKASLALYAADAAARESLAALVREAGCRIAGIAETPLALRRLLDEARLDAIVTRPRRDTDPGAWLAERRAPFIVLAAMDEIVPLRAALAETSASILPQDADAAALRLAIEAAKRGFSLVPGLSAVPRDQDPAASRSGAPALRDDMLTPRELEVLAAMADGASNKAIARRLGISFHTVKFHVASILEKLDADSRTEAVAEGARRGLVML